MTPPTDGPATGGTGAGGHSGDRTGGHPARDDAAAEWVVDIERGGLPAVVPGVADADGVGPVALVPADEPLDVPPADGPADATVVTIRETDGAWTVVGEETFLQRDATFGSPAAFRSVCRDGGFRRRPVGVALAGRTWGYLWPGKWATLWTTVDPLTGVAGAGADADTARTCSPGDAGRVTLAGPAASALEGVVSAALVGDADLVATAGSGP